MPQFRFYHPIEIRYGDLDPQGHLNNAKYLTFFEQARIQYLTRLGLFKKGQSFIEIGIILAEARVTFLAPVQFGTQIKIGMRISRIGNKSMTADYAMQDGSSNKDLATGSAVLVAFDYRTGKSIQVPEDWRKMITQFEKD